MKFRLFKEFGALNSPEIFHAIEQGLIRNGHTIVKDNEDISVIWSVLWKGRMLSNRNIYLRNRSESRPTMIIEVGNLCRGKSWRLSFGNINGEGEFKNITDLDFDRPRKLGVSLNPEMFNRKPEILVACQHQESLQWEGMPQTVDWAQYIINEIKKRTNRPIVIRPHPRNPFRKTISGATIQSPKMIRGTYDDFDIDYNYHVVINHNSGPAVQAAIAGVPVICDKSSLAFPVSSTLDDIENPQLSDREEWFLKLCHTEWTVEEIRQGIPFERLLEKS